MILDKIVYKVLWTAVGTELLSNTIELKMKNYDTDVQPPVDTVSMILATYNEEPFIEECVKSLKDQSIVQQYPEYFETILVDSQSKDKTVEIAIPYIDKIVLAPRGKLTSRNMATDLSKGNIIVSVDADTQYPYHWLNTLLKPFNDPTISAVSGSTFDYTIPSMPGQLNTIGTLFNKKFLHPNQMYGRNCAYWKHLFYLTGKFNENINQFMLKTIIKEEEYDFGDRLAKFGKVVFKLNASCIHFGGIKSGCRLGTGNKDICNTYKFGKDRF